MRHFSYYRVKGEVYNFAFFRIVGEVSNGFSLNHSDDDDMHMSAGDKLSLDGKHTLAMNAWRDQLRRFQGNHVCGMLVDLKLAAVSCVLKPVCADLQS